MKRRLGLVLFAFCLTGLLAAAAPAGREAQAEPYIVVLKDGAVPADVASAHAVRPSAVYRHALNGFAASVPAGRLAALQRDPRVLYVEADQLVHAYAQATPTGINRIFAPGNAEIDIDGTDDFRVDVDVAVIDTGIDLDHPDLNVFRSTNCAGGGPFNQSCGSGGDDGNGHGTHVAGTIGAIDNGTGVVGVAPGARLWAVRVLGNNGSGYLSWIVAGIDYVTANAASIEVANMSLGCECSSAAMDTAITNSVNAGVVYAVAAGNSDANAATHSPANHPDVITVSALADFNGQPGGGAAPTCRADQDDTLADFSNWGSTVEIAAPGVCILSTVPGGYDTFSGTSMASPHVAGAAALLASKDNPNSRSAALSIRSTLVNTGNLDWTDDSGDGIKERLLDVSNTTVYDPALVAGSGGGGGEEPPPPPPPDGSFTLSASGYKVKGLQKADLTWSGAASATVDVYRNGAKLTTTADDGAHTDNIDQRGGGSYTYKVCEAGTSTCSNEATVTF